eukprot:764891-Hanusia_phi.AAC.2
MQDKSDGDGLLREINNRSNRDGELAQPHEVKSGKQGPNTGLPVKRRKMEVVATRDAISRQKEADELLKRLQLTFESSTQRKSVLEKELLGKTSSLKEASRRVSDLEEGLERKREEGEALKRKILQLQDALTCSICLTRTSLFLFNCGHSFCCGEQCRSSVITSCPLCVSTVTKKIKLFSTSNFANVAIQSNDVDDSHEKLTEAALQEAGAWITAKHGEAARLEDQISAVNKSTDKLSSDLHRIQHALASAIDCHARNLDNIQNFVEGLALFSDVEHLNPSILEVFSEKQSLQIKKDLKVRKRIDRNYESGAIEDIFKQMGLHMDRAGIQEKAVRMIQKLINNKKDNETVINSLKSTSGVAKIVQAMVNHEDSEGLQTMGCDILRKVAESNIELLTSVKGIVEALCNAIRLFGKKSTVQTNVCKTMILLSSEKDNTKMRVHLIEGLIQAMCWNLNNEEIQIAGCRVIRNLSILEEEKVSVCRHGGVNSVVNAMKNHVKSSRVQVQGCAALMNIAGNSNNSVSDSIMHNVHEVVGGSNAIEVVVEAMRSHRENEEVQIHGIAAIRNLAWSQRLKVMIAPAGGIEEVISAMKTFPLNSQIQVHGCAAVKNLSSNAVENKKRIGAGGGIAAVLNTLELHVQNQDVMMQACAALRNLASLEQNKEILKELGGSKVVIVQS